MSRWSPRLVDDAELTQLASLPIHSLGAHANAIAAMRPHPRDLSERWERQRWSAHDVGLDADRLAWSETIPAQLRAGLREILCMFVVGEYTAVDLLSSIMRGAPGEEELLFLGTQAADEALHMRFMQRVAEELLGIRSTVPALLDIAWAEVSPGSRALSVLEEKILSELAANPSSYARWLRAVAVFHLVTEGVLALIGQRRIVAGLRRLKILPGVTTGFSAMARDESRHVAFGLHALRRGITEGYADEVCDVLESACRLAVTVDFRAGSTPAARRRAARTGHQALRAFRARLSQLDLDDAAAGALYQCACHTLRAATERPS